MAALMYTLLFVAYGFSVWSLLRQSRFRPLGMSPAMESQAAGRTEIRALPRNRERAAAA